MWSSTKQITVAPFILSMIVEVYWEVTSPPQKTTQDNHEKNSLHTSYTATPFFFPFIDATPQFRYFDISMFRSV